MNTRTSLVLLVLMVAACECAPPPPEGTSPLGDGFERIAALDATTVSLRFARPIDESTVGAATFEVANFTVVPAESLAVTGTLVVSSEEVQLTVGTPLLAGQTYTLTVAGVRDRDGFEIAGTLNFGGAVEGSSVVFDVEVRLEDVETARQWADLAVLASVTDGGAYSERLELYPLTDEGTHFSATLTVQVAPDRTLDPTDDTDLETDRRPFAVRVVDGAGRMASPLVPFVLPSADAARQVVVPVLPPPEIVVPVPEDPLPDPPVDANPGDGKRPVRIVVDDRAARELVAPSLKLAFDASGNFDSSFPRSVSLSPVDGFAGLWGVVVELAVDENRTAEGTTESTFPYFAFVVEQGVEYENLAVALTAPDETPVTVRLSLGNPEWTPVTFRVDVSGAYLTPDGSQRGVYPSESVFLTGEWQQSVDAFGANTGDAFSGGEQPNLRMRELAGFPGVWTRTLWLPPGRPYGWKVVRCDTADGCGPLNQFVASAGRAFFTVMKNLATDNVDAFGDPAVGLIDPLAPASIIAGGQTFDYSSATVFAGSGIGSEPDPSGTPDGQRMFKQEAPDLVVVVGEEAVKTRVVHVGTWRDVNAGQTPAEVVQNAAVVEVTPLDYDDGMIGRFPPSREEP